MLRKKLLFSILFSLTLQSYNAQAMDEPVYWESLTNSKKNVVRAYEGFLYNVMSEFNEVPSPFYCAIYDEASFQDLKKQENNRVLSIVSSKKGNWTKVLEGADFSPQEHQRISAIFLDAETKLIKFLAPIQIMYDELRQANILTQDNAESFQTCSTEASNLITDTFPSNQNAMRKLIFPAYLGEKPPLNSRITSLLQEIEHEMQKRQDLDHDETVMFYGLELAQKYFPQIMSLLPDLITVNMAADAASLPSYVALEEFVSGLQDNDLKDSLTKRMEEKAEFSDRKTMERALTECINCDTTSIRGLNAGLVWRSTYRLVRSIYDQDKNAKNLVLAYFMKINEQDNRCQTGGIGRNFQVFVQAYKYLIERKSENN